MMRMLKACLQAFAGRDWNDQGRVGRQPPRLDVEARLGPLDHRLRRADFGLADGTIQSDSLA